MILMKRLTLLVGALVLGISGIASGQEFLKELGIPDRFNNYREKFLKTPCYSKSIDVVMDDIPYHVHYYRIPGENRIMDVIEYFPFEEGKRSEHPLFYVFDINGDGIIQGMTEIFVDPLKDYWNGNEELSPVEDKQEHNNI